MRNKTCCFTGHRALPARDLPAIERETERRVRALIQKGIIYFGVGGAIGYDTLAAKLLFRLQETEFPQIRVILVYPFDGFTDRWNSRQKAEYELLLPKYDKIVRVTYYSGSQAYLKRDRYLVDNSCCCIAYCTRQTGGTAYTLRYAESQGIPVYNIAPEE